MSGSPFKNFIAGNNCITAMMIYNKKTIKKLMETKIEFSKNWFEMSDTNNEPRAN